MLHMRKLSLWGAEPHDQKWPRQDLNQACWVSGPVVFVVQHICLQLDLIKLCGLSAPRMTYGVALTRSVRHQTKWSIAKSRGATVGVPSLSGTLPWAPLRHLLHTPIKVASETVKQTRHCPSQNGHSASSRLPPSSHITLVFLTCQAHSCPEALNQLFPPLGIPGLQSWLFLPPS